MAFPVTHVLVPMLIVETYRRYFAARDGHGTPLFSKWYVFLAGLIGGSPDFDFLVSLVMTGGFDRSYHRTATHSMWIPIILLVTGLIVYALYSKKVLRYKGWKHGQTLMFIGATAFTTHILLDGICGFSDWFYPLDWQIIWPNLIKDKYIASVIDGMLLFVWILYDEKYFYDILGWIGIKVKRK